MDAQSISEGDQPLAQPLPMRRSVEEMLRPYGDFYATDTRDHRQNVAEITAASSGNTREENVRLQKVIRSLLKERDYTENYIRDRDSIFARETSNFNVQRAEYLTRIRALQRKVNRLEEQILQSNDDNQSFAVNPFDLERAVSAYQAEMRQQQADHAKMMEMAHREQARLEVTIKEQAAKIRLRERKLDENEREFSDLATFLEAAQRLNAETAFERITQAADIMDPNSPPIPSDEFKPLPRTSSTLEGQRDQTMNEILGDGDGTGSVQSFGSYIVDQLSDEHLSDDREYHTAEQCMNSYQSDAETDSNEEEDFGTIQFSGAAIQMSHEMTADQQPEETANSDLNPSPSPHDTVVLQPDVYNPNDDSHQHSASFQRGLETPRVAAGFWQFLDDIQGEGESAHLHDRPSSVQQGPAPKSSSSLVILEAPLPAPQQDSSSSSSTSLTNLQASLSPFQQAQNPSLSSSSVVRAVERGTTSTHPGVTTGRDQSPNSSMTSTTTQNNSQRPNTTQLPLSKENTSDNSASFAAATISRNGAGSSISRQTHSAMAPILTNLGLDSSPEMSLALSPTSGTITDATDGSVGHRIDRAIEHAATYGVVDVGDIDTIEGSEHGIDVIDQSLTYNLRANVTENATTNHQLAIDQRPEPGSRSIVGNTATQISSSSSKVAPVPQTDMGNNIHRAPHTEDHQDDVGASGPADYSVQIAYDPLAPALYAPLSHSITPPVQPANTRRSGQWISVLVIDNEDIIVEQERRRMILTPNSANQLSSAFPADATMVLETERLGPIARRELDEWGQKHLFSSGQIYGLLDHGPDTVHQDNAQDPHEIGQAGLQSHMTDSNNGQTDVHHVQNVSNPAMTSEGEVPIPEQGVPAIVIPEVSRSTENPAFRIRDQPLNEDSSLRSRYQRPSHQGSILTGLDIFNLAGGPRVGIQDQPIGQGVPLLCTDVPSHDSEPTLVPYNEATGGASRFGFHKSIVTRQWSHIWTAFCACFSWLLMYVSSVVLYPIPAIVAAYQSTVWLIQLLQTTPLEELAPILHTIGSVIFDQCKSAIQHKFSLLKKNLSWSFLYFVLGLYIVYIICGAPRERDDWYTANTSTMRGRILAHREDKWEWSVVTYLRWFLQLAIERQSGGPVQIMLT